MARHVAAGVIEKMESPCIGCHRVVTEGDVVVFGEDETVDHMVCASCLDDAMYVFAKFKETNGAVKMATTMEVPNGSPDA